MKYHELGGITVARIFTKGQVAFAHFSSDDRKTFRTIILFEGGLGENSTKITPGIVSAGLADKMLAHSIKREGLFLCGIPIY